MLKALGLTLTIYVYGLNVYRLLVKVLLQSKVTMNAMSPSHLLYMENAHRPIPRGGRIKIVLLHFPGKTRGQLPWPSKDLKTLIHVIFMLPDRGGSLVRQAAAKVFIRFMGGDLSLVGDVQRMNEAQSFLIENDPEHPLRIFGEAVERSIFFEFFLNIFLFFFLKKKFFF